MKDTLMTQTKKWINAFKNVLAVSLIILVAGCDKSNFEITPEILSMKPTTDQYDIASNLLVKNGLLEPEMFNALDYKNGREIYKKLSAANRKSLWHYKIRKLAKYYQNDDRRVVFLVKVAGFLEAEFDKLNYTKSPEKLDYIYKLESEAREIFGPEYKGHFGTPRILQSDSEREIYGGSTQSSFIILTTPKIPDVASCNCNVISDYCTGGRNCFSPRVQCDSNSDWFCGFLLLQPCDGVCL